MSVSFEDFVLTIDGQPNGYTVEVRGPSGSSLAPVPFVLEEDHEFHSLLEDLQDGVRLEPLQLEKIGTVLFEGLFPRRVWRIYSRTLQGLAKGDELRLKLNVRVPDLARLPWELLYDEDEAAFLARRRDRPLVRTLDATRLAAPLRINGPLRLLHVQASPRDLEALDLDSSQKALQETLGQWAEVISLIKATPEQLREALRDNYHILHYDGHAVFDEDEERGLLFLHDEENKTTLLTAEMLADYLAGTSVRLVVLSACETGVDASQRRFAGIAQHLIHSSSIPALVAMQFPIEDQAAIAFNRGFYSALMDGQPVEVAVVEGRLAMRELSDKSDWLAPLLFIRVEDGNLFALQSVPQRDMLNFLNILAGRRIEAEDWKQLHTDCQEISFKLFIVREAVLRDNVAFALDSLELYWRLECRGLITRLIKLELMPDRRVKQALMRANQVSQWFSRLQDHTQRLDNVVQECQTPLDLQERIRDVMVILSGLERIINELLRFLDDKLRRVLKELESDIEKGRRDLL